MAKTVSEVSTEHSEINKIGVFFLRRRKFCFCSGRISCLGIALQPQTTTKLDKIYETTVCSRQTIGSAEQ